MLRFSTGARKLVHVTEYALTGIVPEFDIVDRLRRARDVAGLDQQQLAALTQISRATISNYEDRTWPRRRNPIYLRTIARACGVDETWLLEGQPPRPSRGGEIGNNNGLDTVRFSTDSAAFPHHASRFAHAA